MTPIKRLVLMLAIAILLAIGIAPGLCQFTRPGDRGAEPGPQRAELRELIDGVAPMVDAAEARLRGTSPTADADLALARLSIIEARMAVDDAYFNYYGREFVDNRLTVAKAAANLAADGRPIPIKPGMLQERGYFTEDDGTVQPYHVIIPKGYKENTPTPMIVFCHGYDPYTTKIFPWVPEYMQEPMDAVGALFVIPYGRRNTDFLGPGEADVLAVIDEVKREFNVDPARVYLSGVSAGASGVWTLATHYPDLFAGVLPICGRADYYIWKEFAPEALPVPRRLAVSINNPIEISENLRNVWAQIYHGLADPYIEPQHSRAMLAALEPFGRAVLHEETGGGHRVWEEIMPRAEVWRDLLALKLDPQPERVTYKAFSPKYHRAYWVEVEEINEFGKPFSIDARITGADRVEVKAENVLRAKLHLPGIDEGKWQVTGLPDGEPPAGLRKKPSLIGPVENAYCGPFVMVYGTTGDAATNERVRTLAEINARHWDEYADGLPQLLADSEVTDEVLRGKNLILFGRPEENSIVAQIAGELPLQFVEGGFAYMGQEFVGDDIGAAIVYPNPLSWERLIVIHAGALWCKKHLELEPNHRLDWLTDIAIFRESASERKLDDMLLFGWFDIAWQPSAALAAEGPMQPEPPPVW